MKHSSVGMYAQFAQQIAELLEQEHAGAFLEALCQLIVECGQPWCIVAIKKGDSYQIHSRYGAGVPEEVVFLSDFDHVGSYPCAVYRLECDDTNAAVIVPAPSHSIDGLIAIARSGLLKIYEHRQRQLLQHALLERNHLLETMFEVVRDATLSTSRERLLHIAGLRLMAHGLTTQLFIAARDAQNRWILWSRGLSPDSTMLDQWLLEAGKLDAEAHSLFHMTQEHFQRAGMTTSVPLVVRNRPVGVIGMRKRLGGQFLSNQDEFLTAYANALAISLDQLALMERVVEQEQLERELAMARAIQQRLLPKTEALAECSAADIAAYLEPARHVSGDYYDIVFRQGKVLCVIADVCGKGMGAALIMAHLHSAFHLLAAMNASAAGILREWNRLLLAHTAPGSFVTAVALEYDTQRGILRYCNAGHPPPLLVSSNGVVELTEGALVLGVDEGVEYRESTILLPEGAKICLYSDGVVEARSGDDSEFGLEGIRATLAETYHLTAVQSVGRIIDALNRHRGNNPFTDDCTLIILRRPPT